MVLRLWRWLRHVVPLRRGGGVTELTFRNLQGQHTMDLLKCERSPDAVAVTGLWALPHKRPVAGSRNSYDQWMRHTMRLNVPMVAFGDKSGLERIHAARSGWKPDSSASAPQTFYWERNLTSFRMVNLLQNLSTGLRPSGPWVYTEKVELVRLVAQSQRVPPCFKWFAWYDAGLNLFRDRDPPNIHWPAARAMARLPRDRVIVTFKGENPECARHSRFAAEWRELCIGGTSWIGHRSMIAPFAERYFAMFSRCLHTLTPHGRQAQCIQDQYILSAMLNEDERFFYSVGRGWAGNVVDAFYPDGTGFDVNGTDFQAHICHSRPKCVFMDEAWGPGVGVRSPAGAQIFQRFGLPGV